MEAPSNENRLIHQDVRVTVRGPRFAPQPRIGEKIKGFALAHLSRYAGVKRQAGRARFIFQQIGPGVTIYQDRRETMLNFAPRLALAIFSWLPHPASERPAGPALPAPRLERHVETVRLVQRVFQRMEERDSGPAAHRPAAIYRRPAQPAGPADPPESFETPRPAARVRPVGRVFQRPSIPPVSPEAASASFQAQPPSSSPFHAERENVRPAVVLKDSDIQVLTERVIRSIDQRVIARRERSGRV